MARTPWGATRLRGQHRPVPCNWLGFPLASVDGRHLAAVGQGDDAGAGEVLDAEGG